MKFFKNIQQPHTRPINEMYDKHHVNGHDIRWDYYVHDHESENANEKMILRIDLMK